jgi:hypothetical protein
MKDNERMEDLLRLAQEAAQPQLTETSLQEAFGEPDRWPLRPGAVWRARWDDIVQLVVLVDVAGSAIRAAPVTVDETDSADDVLVIQSPARLGTPATVWKALLRELSTAALDRPVDDFGPAVAEWVTTGVAAEATHVPPGTLPFQGGDPVFAAAEENMDTLAAAAPVATAPAAERVRQQTAPSAEELGQLKERLRMPLPTVLQLVDGKLSPTTEQATVLQDVLGFAPDVVAVPLPLVHELSLPRWKRTVIEFAARQRQPEAAARRNMTGEVFAFAARQTGEQEPDWRERLNRWADAQGLTRP